MISPHEQDKRDRLAEWDAHCRAHPNPPAGPRPDFYKRFHMRQLGIATVEEYEDWRRVAYGLMKWADFQKKWKLDA